MCVCVACSVSMRASAMLLLWGKDVRGEWHIFIILIVSCINVIVAPGNPSIITSVGMEVYNSVVKFQRDCTCTS